MTGVRATSALLAADAVVVVPVEVVDVDTDHRDGPFDVGGSIAASASAVHVAGDGYAGVVVRAALPIPIRAEASTCVGVVGVAAAAVVGGAAVVVVGAVVVVVGAVVDVGAVVVVLGGAGFGAACCSLAGVVLGAGAVVAESATVTVSSSSGSLSAPTRTSTPKAASAQAQTGYFHSRRRSRWGRCDCWGASSGGSRAEMNGSVATRCSGRGVVRAAIAGGRSGAGGCDAWAK